MLLVHVSGCADMCSQTVPVTCAGNLCCNRGGLFGNHGVMKTLLRKPNDPVVWTWGSATLGAWLKIHAIFAVELHELVKAASMDSEDN